MFNPLEEAYKTLRKMAKMKCLFWLQILVRNF